MRIRKNTGDLQQLEIYGTVTIVYVHSFIDYILFRCEV